MTETESKHGSETVPENEPLRKRICAKCAYIEFRFCGEVSGD